MPSDYMIFNHDNIAVQVERAREGVRKGPLGRQADYVDDLLTLHTYGALTDRERDAFDRVRQHDWITCPCEHWHAFSRNPNCAYRNGLGGNWDSDQDWQADTEAMAEGFTGETVADLYREL